LAAVAGAAVIGSDVDLIHQFRMQIALIQHAAVSWLHSAVPKLLAIKPADLMHWYRAECLHRYDCNQCHRHFCFFFPFPNPPKYLSLQYLVGTGVCG